jgi:hypothetical protein
MSLDPSHGILRQLPAQFDRGRQLAALLEDDADRGSIRLGDDKLAFGSRPASADPT